MNFNLICCKRASFSIGFIFCLLLAGSLLLLSACASGVSGNNDPGTGPETNDPCVDADSDGHFIYIAVTCPNGTDYCDDDPVSHSRLGCESCVDNDGDGYGENCDFGSDCDDEDAEHYDVCPVPRVEPRMPWPDSGQSKCYNSTEEIVCPAEGEDYYGQDGNYSINPMSFTDNGDGTVTDNVTGLIWQQNEENFIFREHEFSDFIDYCDNLGLAGHNDWRVPVFYELLSIVDYGAENQVLASNYFTANTSVASYPSSSLWSFYVSLALPVERTDIIIDFDGADGRYNFISSEQGYDAVLRKLRCVRGESAYASGVLDFTDNGDGTVTDNITSLVWQKATSEPYASWKQALKYCQDLELGGYSDWRLPDVKEMGTVMTTINYPDSTYQAPFTYYEDPELSWVDTIWSSTTVFHDTAASFGTMPTGWLTGYTTKWDSFNRLTSRARCVQGG